MTDLLLIIDRLVANDLSESEIDNLTDQLVYWVKNTAARAGRDLLRTSPAERLNLPPGQFPEHTLLRVAESYADSFYPEEFDKYRDTLADHEPGAPRLKALRWRFIDWLKATWKREDEERPFLRQVPVAGDDGAEQDASNEQNALLTFTPESEPEDRREALKENLRRFLDPLAAWRERNQQLKLWQPACNLLRSTDGRLEIVPLRLDRQQLLVPSQAEIDDCWFRALWVIVCKKPNPSAKRSRALTIRELADIIGIDPDRVDYLIRLEKEFQSAHQKS